MSLENLDNVRAARQVATSLVTMSDNDRLALFSNLRSSRRLFRTVCGLNQLLRDPVSEPAARHALKRLGFDASA